MKVWAHIAKALEAGEPCAMVSVYHVEGSAPREEGARLVLTPRGFHGTIGGGALEWRALAEAQRMMKAAGRALSVSRHALGPELGQCCGGRVELLTEVFDRSALAGIRELAAAEAAGSFRTVGRLAGDHVERRIEPQSSPSFPFSRLREKVPDRADEGVGSARGSSSREQDGEASALPTPAFSVEAERTPSSGLRPPSPASGRRGKLERGFVEQFGETLRPLYLYGAGHVGRALVLALAPLPFAIRWIDPRPDSFPAAMPANVIPVEARDPLAELDAAPAGTFLLVMTHSHALDLAIVDKALRDARFPYVGLIGSASKRARFLSRLRQVGMPDDRLAAFKCPIGVAGITSKEPAVIAAATVAELLERDEMLRTGRIPGFPARTPSRIAAKKGQGG
ncbi:MAG: xanthine dehydrogenase accessory protein XdhC [Pseudomonadota bacterium]